MLGMRVAVVAIHSCCNNNNNNICLKSVMQSSMSSCIYLIYGVVILMGQLSTTIASPNSLGRRTPHVKFGDLSGDEIAIDQVKEYLAARAHQNVGAYHPQPPLVPLRNEAVRKIPFAVPPSDQRFFLNNQDQFQEDIGHPFAGVINNNNNNNNIQSGHRSKYPISNNNNKNNNNNNNNDLLHRPQDHLEDQEYLTWLQQYPGVGEEDGDIQGDGNQFIPNGIPDSPPYVNYQDDNIIPPPPPPLPQINYRQRYPTNMNQRPQILPDKSIRFVGYPDDKISEQKKEIHSPNDAVLVNHPREADGDADGDDDHRKEATKVDHSGVNYLQRSQSVVAHPGYSEHTVEGLHGAHRRQPAVSDFYFTVIVAACTTAAVCAIVGTGMCWYRLHKHQRETAAADYPAYGETGPSSRDLSPGVAERKLAQSAHMYHYQHQKQQMIALDKSQGGERHGSASDVDSEDDGEVGHYTVYECPGLASTGEMEVRNPLFSDDPTPVTPATKDQDEGTTVDTPEPQEGTGKP